MRSSRSRGRSSDATARAPTARQLKVGEELRHVLAEVLAEGDLRDPALHDRSITVSEVRVGADLRRATAFVMPLGGDDVAAVMVGLNRAAPFLRREVARRVRLRFAPEIEFVPDAGFVRAERIDRLLHDVVPEDAPEDALDVTRDDDPATDHGS